MDWGDVPTWIQAVTTTAALIAAALAVRLELKAGRERDSEAVERGEDKRRAQASAVVIWPSRGLWPYPGVQDYVVYHDVTVSNASDLPIFDAALSIAGSNGVVEDVWTAAVLPPGARVDVSLDEHTLALGAEEVTIDGVFVALFGNARLAFTDAAGRKWERLAGLLSER